MNDWKITWTDFKKEKAIEKLTEYFEKYGPGECIYQSDKAQKDSLQVLAIIADMILHEGDGIIYNEERDD